MKIWLIVIVVAVLAALAYYFYQAQTAVPEPPAPVVEAPPELPEPVPEPEPEPLPQAEPASPPPVEPVEDVVEAEPSPPLEQSDPLAEESLQEMLGEDTVQRYFETDDLIPRAVAMVDALAARQVPGPVMVVRPPPGEFEVTADEQPDQVIRNEQGDPIPQYLLDPVNYDRYDDYIRILEAADPQQTAALFERHYPLFQEAFQQMGYSDTEFENRLLGVIDEMLATPRVERPVRLIKPEAYYLFADPELEALSAGQKILIRMGPENAARVKAKLREIRAALEAAGG